MTKSMIALFGAVLMMGVGLAPSDGVLAGEIVKTSGRTVYHITKAQAAAVGDVPGHLVGIAESSGLNFDDNGEVGTYYGVFTFDYINGTGTHEAYTVTTYKDGSTTILKTQGTTRLLKDGISRFSGEFTYVKGTGRFEGIQGTGVYTGRRVSPLNAGGDCYSLYNGTYTLP